MGSRGTSTPPNSDLWTKRFSCSSANWEASEIKCWLNYFFEFHMSNTLSTWHASEQCWSWDHFSWSWSWTWDQWFNKLELHGLESSGPRCIKLTINGKLDFHGKFHRILDADWLWCLVAMVVTIESKVTINGKFYATGLRS